MPTINEAEGVGKTIESIDQKFFEKNNWEYEIVIIDASSTDGTQEIAKKKGAKVITESRRGYGRAYKTGFQQVDGDILVTGDADATYPFDKIHEYISILLDDDLDFISTNRFAELHSGSMSVKHHFGNLLLAWTLRLLYFVNIKDSQSGMWIFKKKALDLIQPLEDFDDGMPFSEEIKIEMFTNKKVKAKEIPSRLYMREGSKKLDSYRDGWRNLKFLIKKRISK